MKYTFFSRDNYITCSNHDHYNFLNRGGGGGGAGGTYTYASPGGSAYAATSLHSDNENYYNDQTSQYEPYDDQRQA